MALEVIHGRAEKGTPARSAQHHHVPFDADGYNAERMIGEGRAEAKVSKARWMIGLLHPIHDLPIAEIDPPIMLAALRRISATGRFETAR